LQVADSLSGTGCVWWDREPFEQQVVDDDLGRRQRLGYVGQASDDARDLPRFAVGEGDDGSDAIGILSREVIELARAVVVNDDNNPVAAGGLDLELVPDAGRNVSRIVDMVYVLSMLNGVTNGRPRRAALQLSI
jgi:hypothetical protein